VFVVGFNTPSRPSLPLFTWAIPPSAKTEMPAVARTFNDLLMKTARVFRRNGIFILPFVKFTSYIPNSTFPTINTFASTASLAEIRVQNGKY
jgi:hypothetical protein